MLQALVPSVHQLEQQVGGPALEGEVAQFVDDQQLGLPQVDQPLLQPAFGFRPHHLGHQPQRRDKQAACPSLDSLPSQSDRQMGLSHAGRPQQEHVLPVGDEPARLPEQLPVNGGLEAKVEVIQGPYYREMSDLSPMRVRFWSFAWASSESTSSRKSR